MQLHESSGNRPLPSHFPKGIPEYLRNYGESFNFNPGPLMAQYSRCPVRYTLDSGVAIGTDPSRMAEKMAGVRASFAGGVKSFGFTYVQTGLVLLADQRAPKPHNRTTIFMIDSRAMHLTSPQAFSEILSSFDVIAERSNHDPLHSILGDNKQFIDVDSHLRFGGVEFAPIVAHGAMVRSLFHRNPSAEASLLESSVRYLDAAKAARLEGTEFSGFAGRLYFASIALRHLLLILPVDAPLVQNYLRNAASKLFENRDIVVTPDRFMRFMERDFSPGAHADSIPPGAPAHANRAIPYNHGKDSVIGPWLARFYATQFGEALDKPTTMPMEQLLLADVLARGHGIFAIQSAVSGIEQSELVERCCRKFLR